jgi:hypothetical protein
MLDPKETDKRVARPRDATEDGNPIPPHMREEASRSRAQQLVAEMAAEAVAPVQVAGSVAPASQPPAERRRR